RHRRARPSHRRTARGGRRPGATESPRGSATRGALTDRGVLRRSAMSSPVMRRMQWSGVVLLIVMAAAVTGIALSSLTMGRASGAKLERPGLQDERRAPTLAEHLATIDAAIA